VRVRITQRLSGSIDGIQLSRFEVGVAYEVGTTLANYLLAEGLAEPIDPSTPAIVVPIQDHSQADDRSRRKRPSLKKGR
jgi:hypothetical protein